MRGQIISRQELLARWAFAEANSSRFGQSIRRHLGPSLEERLSRARQFGQVAQADWEELVKAFWEHRPAEKIGHFLPADTDSYVCAHWTASDLLNCRTLPGFGSVPFFRFLALPPGRSKDGRINRHDPRFVASQIPYSAPYTVVEPVIAAPKGAALVLHEGYLRSILWLRAPATPLPVWLPVPPERTPTLRAMMRPCTGSANS